MIKGISNNNNFSFFIFYFILIILTSTYMSLKPKEFIKKIRACKTLDEERCLINKESAEIRNLNKVISY